MTTFVFDQLSDVADRNVDDYGPAYTNFLDRGGDDVGDFGACSVSPSGGYTAGGSETNTLWVVKTTPAGTPTKVLDSPYDGVTWSADVPGDNDQDILPHAVDDDGFIWGTSYLYGTAIDFPLGARTKGIVGYIDPANSAEITKAFTFSENGAAGANPDGFDVSGIFTFTMPDDSIRILVFPQGTDNALVYDHLKGDTDNYTVHNSGGVWIPSWPFQDSNGDIWISGSDPDVVGPTTAVGFMRITDVTGSSAFPTPQLITVPPTVTYASSAIGYFANGYFIGGWQGDVDGTVGVACSTVFKIHLDGSETVTSADFTATPLRLPRHPSPANPTYYFVMKSSDLAPLHGSMSRIFYNLPATLVLGQTYNLNQWVASDTGNDSGNTYDDVYTQYWSDTRQAFIGQRYQYMLEDGSPDPFFDRIASDLFIYYFGSGGGDGDSDTDDSLTLRVWEYSLDGHDFYVLRVGPSETLVYDLTTGQWSSWKSPSRENWRAHIGANWLGMSGTTFDRGFGSDVVAGDDVHGLLWVLDPVTGVDDNPTTGTSTFTRMVIGGVPASGRDTIPCGAVELTASVGNPALVGAAITLRTSDDKGNTYHNHGTVITTAGSFDQVVEWRALGLIKHPGRLFELSDNGAAVRINSLDMR